MGVFDVRQQKQETEEQKQQRIDTLVNSTQDKVLLSTPDLYVKSDMPANYSQPQQSNGFVSDTAKYVKESNVWKNLFYTDQDKLIEAKSFTDKYGVPTEVILKGGTDALNNLRAMDNTYETNKKIFGQEGKQFSLDNLYELYPEMKTIVDKDTNSAVLALKNMQNVQETKGIFDSIVTGYNRMQDYIKRGDIGARMALGEDTPELQAELTRLEDNLKKYRTTDGFSHPLEKVLGETAAQGGMMLTQYARGFGKRAGLGLATGVGIGSMAGGVGAVPAGIVGLKIGADVGFAEEMFRNSTGNKYLDNIQRGLDKNMSRKQALTYGAIDTAIEFVATKYMAKAVGKVTPNSALKEIMNNASERVALARGSLTTMLKTSGKVGGSELLEEGLQDVNDKLQDNAYGVKHNSLGDIIEGAVNAMIEAVPSVVGLGLLGGVGGNIKSIRNIINASDGMKKVVVQQEINNIGANVLSQLKENQSSNSLFKKSPEVYAQVVQTQADKIGMGTMYVDVEVAMQSDKGVNALNKMVENGVIKEEQLKQAIETGGTLEVPVGEYMQKVAPNVEDNALHEATAWTDGGINLGKLKMMQEYYSNIQQRIAKEQENIHNQVVNELYDEHFKDSDVALDVLNKNVFDLKRSYLDTQRHAEEVYNELVGMERFKEGMGQGVTIIPTEDGKGVRASNNAKWYSDFYAQNKRKPNNYELRRLALENLSEEVYQQAKTEEEQARADEALNEAQTQLEYLDKLEGLKDKFYELADSDYMLRKTLSKEGLEVYKDVYNTLMSGNGNIQAQAKESAYLFAKHADIMAGFMRNAGVKDFTAKDYAKMHGVQIGGAVNSGAYNQKDITQTAEFKNWFGDSKVVDEEGKPLVVYHTGTMGDSYDITKSRSYNGTPDYEIPGIYLTADKEESLEYGDKSQIKALYVSIQNPYSGNTYDLHKKLGTWRKVMDYLKDEGYDGIVNDDDLGEIIAFSPEQIKSVDNKGTFNPNDVNIYNQKVDNIIKESKQLYDEVISKFPDIVEDRRVKKRVENALQTTLDFGELPDEIIKQTSASDFGGQGGEKSQNEKRKNNSVRNNERIGEQIALGVTRKLVNEGAISLVGHKVNNVRELAELAQVLRHPGYEKFHRIYTNDNNEIIHHETVSCMMPSEASILSPEDDGKLSNLFGRMDNEIREKGANKVYLIHNHPSTNPTPSANDIEVTKNIANLTTSDGKTSIISEKFAGHIILDTDKYCEIKKDGSFDFGKIDEQYQIKMTDAELPSMNLGKVVNSPSAIADLAKNLFDTSKTTAFLMTTKNEVRGVFQLPQQLTTLSKDKILRYLRWLTRGNYSSNIAIVTENENDYNSLLPLVEKGHILDMMLTKTFGEDFARSNVNVKRTSGWMGIPSGENTKRLLEESETYNQSARGGSPYEFDKFSPEHIDNGEQQNRGSLTVYNTGKTIMQLFKSADYSTFIHESGHLFLEDIRMLTEIENAPKEMKQAWETVKEWTGWVEGADNTEAHEKFAKGFEAYMREGKAPSNDLKAAFRKFKAWLVQVYENLTRLGEVPPKEIQRIMDMMIATDAEIKNYVDTQDISSFNKKGFGDLEGNDKGIVKRWKQEIIEKIKERVHSEFMRSYTEQARQEKAEFLERYRVDIERKLIQENKFYEIEKLYKEFGNPVLAKYGITKEQLQEELNKLGGNLDYAVDMKVLEEEKAIDNTIIKGEELKRFADEYLLSDEGQSKIVALERDEMQRKANGVTSEIMKAMRLLNAEEIDVKEVSKVINDLFGTEKSKTNNLKVQLFGKSEEINKLKEQLNELKGEDGRKEFVMSEMKDQHRSDVKELKAKKEFVISQLKNQLNHTLRNLRMVRDATTGNQQLMMEQARRILSQSNISEAVAFKNWQQKAIIAGKEADALIVKGDFEKAMHRKNDQLLYLSLAKVAHDNEKRVNKAVDKLKTNNERISRSEKPIRLGGQERYFYQHLMYKLGLSNSDVLEPTSGFDMKVIKGALNPDVAIEISEDDGGVISRWVENVFYGEDPINWRKLRLEQFEEISTLLGAIYKVGRREYEGSTILDENGKSMSFEDAATTLVQGVNSLGKPSTNRLQEQNRRDLKDEVKSKANSYLLELTKPETIFNRIDGGKAGFWYNLLYRPIERGANKERELMRDANKTLKKIMSRYSVKELRVIRSNRKYQLGKITGFTKEQIMVLALNWGTENNKQRVIGGLNANGADVDVVKIEKVFSEVLTNKDWDFIEDTWKLINSYWQERNNVQERLYGVPLGKEEAVSFTINGREISGGYYPIVYDGSLSFKASEQDVNEIVKQQLSSNAVFGVGMGSTKKRATKVDRMLLLSFDVIPKAVTEAVHHVSMRECSVDVYKLLSRKEVETAIIDKFGIEYYKVLKQWARDNWQTEIKRMDVFERTLNALKRNTTFATLAYRTSTAIINASNIFPMAKELGGVANAVKALYGFYNATNESYKNNRQFVLSKSSFLAERVHNLDKDMTEGLKIGGKQGHIMDAKDSVNRYGYFFITETDLMLSLPLWKQTYETTVAELLKTKTDTALIESEAIAKADRAVRRVFGSGESKDLANIQKKQGLLSFITPFYTYCNTVLNSLIEAGYQVKDKGNVMPMLNAMLFWIVLPTMVETLIRSSYDSDDDDLKTIAKKYGINLGRNAMGGIPVLRDVSDMTLTLAMGEKSFSKGNEVMALSIGEKFYNTMQAIKSDKKDWVDVGRSASQVGNRVVGFSDTLSDGFWSLMKFTFTDTDASVSDLIQAIIFDKKVQEKKKKKTGQ